MTAKARRIFVLMSVGFALGTIGSQAVLVVRASAMNAFTIVDITVALITLVSVVGLLRKLAWGEVLNALSWAAYFAIFVAAQTEFVFFMSADQVPLIPRIATAVGVPLSVGLCGMHLKRITEQMTTEP